MLLNRLHTVFGWTVRVGPDANPRSLRNFPCQANGAEMMRLACKRPVNRIFKTASGRGMMFGAPSCRTRARRT